MAVVDSGMVRTGWRAWAVVANIVVNIVLNVGWATASTAAEGVNRITLDESARAALDLVYDGSTDAGLDRLAALSAESGGDPLLAYLEALALEWKIEQRPDDRSLDRNLETRVNRVVALADVRLGRDARDARARLARGAAHGARSRLALFRLQRSEAARAAVRMREDLLAARGLDPHSKDALFGLALYDYYGDVLPRMLKLLRFLARMPGGDRERGLRSLAEAENGSLFHHTEVQAQIYEIHAFYEKSPDLALRAIEALRRRYPGSPLWALKLTEHLRERLGLFARSATVTREILASVSAGHPNYAPVVGAMARLSLGSALLDDLRPAEARHVLSELLEEGPRPPAMVARARLLLARCLELQGDRGAAVAAYQRASAASDPEVRSLAHAALRDPPSAAQLRGLQSLAKARRLEEAGDSAAAVSAYREAAQAWPAGAEAALRVAEDDLRHGRTAGVREIVARVAGDEATPAWLRALAHLLRGQLADLQQDRKVALAEYKIVFNAPMGRHELRTRAADGLDRPYVPAVGGSSSANAR